MHLMLPAGWLTVVLLATPAAGQTAASSARPAPAAGTRTAIATHSSKGGIQSVSTTAIVITRRVAGKRVETTYALTPATERAGVVSAGRVVEIRYRTEGRQRIATTVIGEAAPR